MRLRPIFVLLLVLCAFPARAHAAADGLAEFGIALDAPFADSGYRRDFQVSPGLWAAGVFLPGYGQRTIGLELDAAWTHYRDEFEHPRGYPTDFDRFRLLFGARAYLPVAPGLTAYARAAAGMDLFIYDATGKIGNVEFEDTDEHVGLGFELGAGAQYTTGPLAVGAQLALPIGVHRQDKHDGTIEIDQTAVDVELRLLVSTRF